jgi:hypothetical protein
MEANALGGSSALQLGVSFNAPRLVMVGWAETYRHAPPE